MAGDGVLAFHFGEMGTVPGMIDGAIKQLGGVLDDLEKAAAPIVATWEGDAKEAYLLRQQLWRDAQRDLGMLLAQVKSAVEASHEEYLSTEKRNAALFGA